MPQTFTPKFVDLVRNVTTVQGSGPAALGAAMPGYTGLAEAVAPGEQFYYCIQGVDKPAEREVGRGTMQAGGTVLREPIGGAATSFTGGTKTIALVAAAEWFSDIAAKAGQSAGVAPVASRAALAAKTAVAGQAAVLVEVGREGVFVFAAGNLSARVAADTQQAIHIAPSSDPSGANGAWVRSFNGPVNVRWFGAKGDATSNDGAAFTAALATVTALAQVATGLSQGAPTLFIPAGDYFLATTTLDIATLVTIEGEGSGTAGGPVSRLRWAANTPGIRLQAFNTSGAATVDAQTHYSAAGSTIRNLWLEGGFVDCVSTPEGGHHGVQARVRFTMLDCMIQKFQGDGLHVIASAGSGGATEGNANGFHVARSSFYYNRNGIQLSGADANAGTLQGCDLSENREWGLIDGSFLGNQHFGHHSSNNGFGNFGAPPSVVSHGGKRYYVIVGQEAWCAANAPTGSATSNQGWRYLSDGGVLSTTIPAWASGTAYRAGGAYRTIDVNGNFVFTGCYSEGGQAPPQCTGNALFLGGTWGSSLGTHGGYLAGGVYGITIPQGDLFVGGQFTTKSAHFGSQSDGSDAALFIDNSSVSSSVYFMSYAAGTPQQSGRIFSQRNLGLLYDSIFYHNLAIGGLDCFHVTASGANLPPGKTLAVNGTTVITASGTFAGPGGVSTGGTIGFAGGAGGSVTQATSKSSAVTLNKSCGQIVMNGAALAANTAVSFTLNDNLVAASDTIIVSIASGAAADSYDAQVVAVAAGSCRIRLRNISSGSLSEAVALNFAVIKAVTA